MLWVDIPTAVINAALGSTDNVRNSSILDLVRGALRTYEILFKKLIQLLDRFRELLRILFVHHLQAQFVPAF